MGFIILLLFIAIPVAEIALFIEAGQLFGLWPTVAAIVATALLGTAFIRMQGMGILRRVQASLSRNEMPLQEVFDGLCLLVAGALLLTPGFITDTVGFCLLVPPLRQTLSARIAPRMAGQMSGRMNRNHHRGGPTIDGDYEDLSENRNGHEAEDTEQDPPPAPGQRSLPP